MISLTVQPNRSATITMLSMVGMASPRNHLKIACGVPKPQAFWISAVVIRRAFIIALMFAPVAVVLIVTISSLPFFFNQHTLGGIRTRRSRSLNPMHIPFCYEGVLDKGFELLRISALAPKASVSTFSP